MAIFVLSRMLMKMADLLVGFAVPLIVFQSTRSIQWAGLAFLVEKLPRLIFLPFGGWLVDHFSPRRMLIASDTLRGLSLIAAFAILNGYPAYTPWAVVAAAVINALLNAQSFVALENLMSHAPKDGKQVRGFMALQMVDQSNVVIAPVLATSILILLAPSLIFALSACLYLMSALLVCLQAEEPPKATGPATSPLQSFLKSARWILGNSTLMGLGFQTMAVNLMLGISVAGGAALVLAKLNLDAKSYGLLQIIGGATSLVCMLALARFQFDKKIEAVARVSFLLMVAGCTLMGAAHSFIGVILGYILLIAPAGVYNVCQRSMRAQVVPQQGRGGIVATHILMGQLSLPVSGFVLSQFSTSQIHWPFVLCGVLSLTALLASRLLTSDDADRFRTGSDPRQSQT